MQPLTPIDRPIAALPARSGGAGSEAFALLLAGIGVECDADAPARQAAAPPGKRLPVTASDPAPMAAMLMPPLPVEAIDVPVPVPVRTVDAAPLAPPLPATVGRVPAMPESATRPGGDLPEAVAAQVAPVPDAGDGRTAAAPIVTGSPDTVRPAPVVRRPMPGEQTAPVINLAPPRPPEPVAAMLVDEGEGDDARDAPAIDRPGEAQPVLAAAEPAPRAVAAPVATDGARLDTRDDRWMQGMIDHIETLRDAAGVTTETRIRLSPDALGTVDVVLHRTGDGVQLRFASDNADAARLLTEAQPRLADLAQQRGVRLSGMQVDVGGGQGSQHRPDPDAAPRRARPVPVGATPADPVTDDIRIA